MSAIETTTLKSKQGKRLIKKSTNVDLTPMVDLGFLLITFFVFTTTMAKPTVMKFVEPKNTEIKTPVCESCVITLLLYEDDQIIYYEGQSKIYNNIKQTTFANDGLRKILVQKKAELKKLKGNANEVVVIIKPTNKSKYKNFVNAVDELSISEIKHYFIDEVNDSDIKCIASVSKKY